MPTLEKTLGGGYSARCAITCKGGQSPKDSAERVRIIRTPATPHRIDEHDLQLGNDKTLPEPRDTTEFRNRPRQENGYCPLRREPRLSAPNHLKIVLMGTSPQSTRAETGCGLTSAKYSGIIRPHFRRAVISVG